MSSLAARSSRSVSYAVMGNALHRAKPEAEVRRKARADAFADLGPVVYYVWRNNLVKIGFTKDLYRRLISLESDPTDLLAIERGTRQDEQVRHRQFHACRTFGPELGVEHYWPTPDLVEHLNDLRAVHGMPDLRICLRPIVE